MSRYSNYSYTVLPNIDFVQKRRYYDSLLDAEIPKSGEDIYVITRYGDRLDLFAFQFYGDAMLWWIIAAANPTLRKDSIFLETATQIRIPADYQSIISLFEAQLNFR